MCLAWLEENVRAGDSVLDYGRLGDPISPLKLAARATGVDWTRFVDARIREASSRSADAQRNLSRCDTVAFSRKWQTLPYLLPHARGAHGSRCDKADQVAQAYAQWAALERVAREGPWVLLAGRRC